MRVSAPARARAAATCEATPRAQSSIAGQSRASRRSGGVFLSIARSTKLPGSVGTRPPNMTFSRAPSCAASRSATGGIGAVGCSSTAPNGPLLNSHTGMSRSAAAWRRAKPRASRRQRLA